MKKLLSLITIGSLTFFPGCKWSTCECPDHGHKHEASSSQETAEPKEHKHEAVPVETKTEHIANHKSSIIHVRSTGEFEEKVLKSSKPAVVEFTAKWCGACQTLKPIFHELADEMGNKYQFVVIDVDAASDLTQKYNINGIPTVSFFKNGKETVDADDRIVGSVEKSALNEAIEQNLE